MQKECEEKIFGVCCCELVAECTGIVWNHFGGATDRTSVTANLFGLANLSVELPPAHKVVFFVVPRKRCTYERFMFIQNLFIEIPAPEREAASTSEGKQCANTHTWINQLKIIFCGYGKCAVASILLPFLAGVKYSHFFLAAYAFGTQNTFAKYRHT